MTGEEPMTTTVVNQIQVMPYWPSYHEWADHYAQDCGQCFTVMDAASGGTGLIEDLCALGSALATAARWDVDRQAILAKLN